MNEHHYSVFQEVKNCWTVFRICSRDESISNKGFFRFSVITWKFNGIGIENSDVANCCDGTFFDVEGVIWDFSQQYYHLERHRCFDSIVATIEYAQFLVVLKIDWQLWYFWWCSFKRSFSAQVCSNEKLQEIFVTVLRMGFAFLR